MIKKVSQDELRLMTWLIMDGTLVVRSENNVRLQFKLSKPRKIKALTKLLDTMKYKYTKAKATMSEFNKLQPYMIRVYGDFARRIGKELLNYKKEFPEWILGLRKKQVRAILSIIAITDASKQNLRYVWSTTCKQDFDLILTLCSMYGIKHTVYNGKRSSGFGGVKKQFAVGLYI